MHGATTFVFWRRSNSEHKWLESRREDEGSGWKNQISEYNILILVKWSKWNLFIYEMTKLPPTPFYPLIPPATHVYIHMYMCVMCMREEEGRREVIA